MLHTISLSMLVYVLLFSLILNNFEQFSTIYANLGRDYISSFPKQILALNSFKHGGLQIKAVSVHSPLLVFIKLCYIYSDKD